MSTPPAPPERPFPTGLAPCYRHPDRMTGIRCIRCERPICTDDMVPASVGFMCPDDVRAGQRTQRQPRTTFGGRLAEGGLSVTAVLVLLNAIVFALTVVTEPASLFGGGAADGPIYRYLALQPTASYDLRTGGIVDGVAQGQYWRLITAMFVHFGLLHIVFNMFALVAFGAPLERALGRWRYAALYLVAGLGGSVASYTFGAVGERAAGASGAIFGLIAGYFVVARKSRVDTSQLIPVLLLNAVLAFVLPGVDWRAHVGGLVAGALAAAAVAYAPRLRRTAVQVGGLAAIVVVEAVVTLLRTSALS